MPIKYTTFTEEEFKFFNNFAEKLEGGELEFTEEDFSRIAVGMKTMLENLKEYQNQRLKINKESRESKKAARDAEGGGARRGASVKMTGAVKLVPLDEKNGIFTIEKVKVPAHTAINAFAPSEIEEEENIAENPEAIAVAVAEATVRKEQQQKKINNARAAAQQKPKQEKKTTITVPKKKTGKAAVIEQLCALAPAPIAKHLQEEHDDDATESESEE